MRLSARFFRWHRWLAYLVVLQVLLWVLGGLVFAWLPFQAWVKSAEDVKRPVLELPADWAARLAAAPDLPAGPVLGVQAVATAAGPAWRIRQTGGETWLGADGRRLPAPDAAAVSRFAAALYRGSGQPAGVERLAEVPSRLGIVRELAGRRDVWVARFDDRLQTRLYVDGRSGEFLTARNEAWVVYDFFWRLHVMDYADGEDFNNPLLRTAAALALGLVLTGTVLVVLALRRRWRRRSASAA